MKSDSIGLSIKLLSYTERNKFLKFLISTFYY